jgi:DNA polymerase/3'-5' exonuclease PolX
MRHTQALKIAEAIENKLLAFTTRIQIAGSVRREKFDVKDIEIVCLPRYVDGAQTGLFSDIPPAQVISQNFVDTVKSIGHVIKGKPDGRYMQIELPQRINLDLFMPQPEDYIRQYVIRTGSADYVKRNITVAWLKKGWCGSDKGLRRQSDCVHEKTADGKGKWVCLNTAGERPPIWQTEQEFFSWLGIPMIMPKLRTI